MDRDLTSATAASASAMRVEDECCASWGRDPRRKLCAALMTMLESEGETSIQVCVHVYACMYVCVWEVDCQIGIQTRVYMSACMHATRWNDSVYIYIYIYTYRYIYIYIYIHIDSLYACMENYGDSMCYFLPVCMHGKLWRQ